ncbi:MAG: two component transcriptional regulator, winged helix family [Anaerocolumna sp.]|jgi:DNA-binding response OmpR family regulator|nr:two component transcriptional regulator, winged helix family [Anaerocolumna sp.]
MATVLLLEDDDGLSRGICFSLEKEGYNLLSASNLQIGRKLLFDNTVDLIILDLNLPDGDGLDFCKEIRTTSNIPIIILTARDLETDEILGFYAGADDYITKPFSISVLKVRVSACLRRSNQRDKNKNDSNTIISNHINMQIGTMKVLRNGIEMELSTTEFKLLKLFLEHKGQVLLKEQILEAIWDKDANFVDENTLPVNIRRLRLKLEDDPSTPKYIKTIHGVGYMWEERG